MFDERNENRVMLAFSVAASLGFFYSVSVGEQFLAMLMGALVVITFQAMDIKAISCPVTRLLHYSLSVLMVSSLYLLLRGEHINIAVVLFTTAAVAQLLVTGMSIRGLTFARTG